ncbi:hypothetical protein P3T27_005980 [Kitasatospora sp. MAA19]|nr:hypothetical protein [Kitasatospora sp. MAA19]
MVRQLVISAVEMTDDYRNILLGVAHTPSFAGPARSTGTAGTGAWTRSPDPVTAAVRNVFGPVRTGEAAATAPLGHSVRYAGSRGLSAVEDRMDVSVPLSVGKCLAPNQTGCPSLSGCAARCVFVTWLL